MRKYQIWNKEDDIYTPTGTRFSPALWAERYPWVNIPGAKMVITTGIINGGCAMEFSAMVENYKRMGANISEGMSDEEILDEIERFENTPPENEPSPEERIAAALEFQNILEC